MYNNLELWDAFIKRDFPTYGDLVVEGKPISRIIIANIMINILSM